MWRLPVSNIKVHVTDTNGSVKTLAATKGTVLMHLITDNDMDLRAECGGCLACATCHVYVNSEWLSKLKPMKQDEQDMLDFADGLRDNSRLSCQIELDDDLDGLSVTIAPIA